MSIIGILDDDNPLIDNRCPQCGTQMALGGSCHQCGFGRASGSSGGSGDIVDVTLENIDKAMEWNGEDVGYLKSIFLGIVQIFFAYVVLFVIFDWLLNVKDLQWLWIVLSLLWGAFAMYATGPFKYWSWKSVLITSPVFIVPMAATYALHEAGIIDGMIKFDSDGSMPLWLPVMVISAIAWWVANKIVKKRF